MTTILVVTDEPWVRNEVHAAVTDPAFELIDQSDPGRAADAAVDQDVDVVIVDLQVGAMGGMAVTRAIRNATGTETDRGTPVIMLLDRKADGFLAGRAGADGSVVKPFTSFELMQVLRPLVTTTSDQPASG